MVVLKAPWLTVDLDQREPTKQSVNLVLSSSSFELPVLTICSSSIMNLREFQASMVDCHIKVELSTQVDWTKK